MSRKKPRKPFDPSQAAKAALERRMQNFTAVNMQPEAATLERQADVEVSRAGEGRDTQVVRHDTARRLDAFHALREGMQVGAYDAARRFERSLMVIRAEVDRGRPMERVDCDGGRDFVDAMAAERREIELVRPLIPPRDWWLLVELSTPSREWGGWRITVAHITGEENPHAQGAAVRSACVNLRDAYERIDSQPRRAA